jgi:biofilm PGA synthesis N-glycosyltransferase PgaC
LELNALKITVGVCAYNEEKNIGNLLNNIANQQQLPPNSEILVVCSGCTDNTAKIVQQHCERDPRIKLIIESERLGKASAMNHILAQGKGDAFIFISADTLPWKACFSGLISRLQAKNVGLVCGKPVPQNNNDSLTDKLVNTLWQFHDHVFKELNDAGLAKHATEVFIIRRGIIDKIPKETINDDAHIALTAKKKGWLIKYNSDSGVSICGPKTFSDYVKQRRRILYGHHQLRKTTGESPQHLLYFFTQHPLFATKLLLWLAKKKGMPTFLVFTSVELMMNLLSLVDYISYKPNPAWSIANSTKNFIGNNDNSTSNIGTTDQLRREKN